MALKLMYITNSPEVAKIAEESGVDRIFIDLEYIGKSDRQGGMDTVQSHHTLEDIKRIKNSLTTAKLLVRVNPIHDATEKYPSTEYEIDTAIKNGAEILMLPYFKKADEVKRFISAVNRRAKTMLLIETPQAVENIDEILQVPGIDFIHIGLNDLSLGYKMKFMFELLTDGTVERLCKKFKESNIEYGFGGIAALGKGAIPAEMVIKEHYRLGSSCAILSRSFCNTDKVRSIDAIRSTFINGMKEIRNFEAECLMHRKFFTDNTEILKEKVKNIVNN